MAACCFFQFYFGFCTAAPTYIDCQASTAKFLTRPLTASPLPGIYIYIRLLAENVSSHRQRNRVKKKKEWPAAPTSKSSASPTPRRTLNATAGRVPAWRAGGARRCRASRIRRTGIRTRRCPRRHAIAATHAPHRYWISPHDEVARSPKYVLALVADFVQCKACAALRRLPGPLSGKAAPHSLADDWSCSQNTWDPAVAYCNALCGNQPVSVASMAWRSTRRFRTNAP